MSLLTSSVGWLKSSQYKRYWLGGILIVVLLYNATGDSEEEPKKVFRGVKKDGAPQHQNQNLGKRLNSTGPYVPKSVELEHDWTVYRNDVKRRGFVDVDAPEQVSLVWKQNGINIGTHTANKGSAVLYRKNAEARKNKDKGSKLLVAGDTGVLYAFDMRGEFLWGTSTAPSGNGIHGTPCLIDDVAYIGNYGGWMFAMDVNDGHTIWSTKVGDSIGASPLCLKHYGLVLISVEFRTPSGRVAVLNSITGEVLTLFDGIYNHPHSSLAFDSLLGLLVVGDNDGVLHCMRLDTLEEVWTFQTGSAIKGSIAITEKSEVIFGSWDSHVYKLDLATGEEIWRFQTKGKVMSCPAIDEGAEVVYIGSRDSKLYAIDLVKGVELWSYQTMGSVVGCPTATNNLVIFGSYDELLYALNKKTGELVWRYKSLGQVSCTPLVTDAYVIFTSRSYLSGGKRCYNECRNAGSLYVLGRKG